MRRAGVPILILVAGTLFSIWGFFNVRLDNDDIIRWLPDKSAAREDYDFFRENFLTDEYVVVSWDECTIDDPRLANLVQRIQPDSSEHLIHSVVSGREMLKELTGRGRMSERQVRRRLQGIFFGSTEADQTCVVIRLTQEGREDRPAAIALIESALAAVAGLDKSEVFMAGYPWVAVNMSRLIEATFERLLLWSAIAATIAALICLRSITLAITGLIAAGLGAGFSIGLGVLCFGGLGGLTMIVPTLGFVLTMSGGLHMMRYALAAPGDQAALFRVSWLPCSVSTITTIVGVMTLQTSNYPAVREFAMLGAGTLLFSLVLQLCVLPWLISRFGKVGLKALTRDQAKVQSRWGRLGRWSPPIQQMIGGIAIATFVFAVAGISRLQPNVEADNLFRKDSAVLLGIARMEGQIGPMDTTEALLVFENVDETDFEKRLEYVKNECAYLQRIPDIERTFGLPHLLPAAPENKGFLGDAWQRMYEDGLRQARDELATGDFLRIESGTEIWRVSLKFPFLSTADFSGMEHRVREAHQKLAEAARQQWPGFDPPRLVYTGATHLVHDAQESLLGDFARSFALAILIITPILIIVLRSLAVGCIGMLANLWPGAMVFGGLGWLQIPIDVALGMTASVALGIAVDDTTHFLIRVREHRFRSGALSQSVIAHSISECGPAMLATTLIACAGIGTYGLSELVVISRFALVISAMLVAAIVADAIILPAVLGIRTKRG